MHAYLTHTPRDAVCKAGLKGVCVCDRKYQLHTRVCVCVRYACSHRTKRYLSRFVFRSCHSTGVRQLQPLPFCACVRACVCEKINTHAHTANARTHKITHLHFCIDTCSVQTTDQLCFVKLVSRDCACVCARIPVCARAAHCLFVGDAVGHKYQRDTSIV